MPILQETLKKQNQDIKITEDPVGFVKQMISIFEHEKEYDLSETKILLIKEWGRISPLIFNAPIEDVVVKGKPKGKARIARISDETYLSEWLNASPNESHVVLYHQGQSLSPSDKNGDNHKIRIDLIASKNREYLFEILIKETSISSSGRCSQIGLKIELSPNLKVSSLLREDRSLRS